MKTTMYKVFEKGVLIGVMELTVEAWAKMMLNGFDMIPAGGR